MADFLGFFDAANQQTNAEYDQTNAEYDQTNTTFVQKTTVDIVPWWVGVFAALATLSFILLIFVAIRIDYRVDKDNFTSKQNAFRALSTTFAALFLMPIPVVNICLAIASAVLVFRMPAMK